MIKCTRTLSILPFPNFRHFGPTSCLNSTITYHNRPNCSHNLDHSSFILVNLYANDITSDESELCVLANVCKLFRLSRICCGTLLSASSDTSVFLEVGKAKIISFTSSGTFLQNTVLNTDLMLVMTCCRRVWSRHTMFMISTPEIARQS